VPYPNEHACRIREPEDFQDGSFRRIKNGDLAIIIGKLSGESDTTTQAFRYPISDWTEARARAHCEKQDGRFEAATGEKDVIEKLGFLRKILNWLTGDSEWEPALLVPENTEEKASTAFKVAEVDGQMMWFTYTTNAFEDREKETFSTKALEEYVAAVDKGEIPAEVKAQLESLKLPEMPQGELWLMHIPRSRIGEPLWKAVEGRFLLEAGKFDDTPMAKATVAYLKGHADEYGLSHGYLYNPSDREDSVYDWFWKFETSLLPVGWAANPWTRFEVKEMEEKNMVDSKKRAELVKLAGGDEGLVDAFLEGAASLGAKLEAEGVSHKEAEAAIEPEAEPKVEAPEEKVEEPVAEEAKVIINNAAPDTKALDELTAAVKDLNAKFAGIAEQITAAVKPVAADVANLKAQSETYARVSSRKSWVRPSQADSTEISAEEAKEAVAHASLIAPANLSDVVATNLAAKLASGKRA